MVDKVERQPRYLTCSQGMERDAEGDRSIRGNIVQKLQYQQDKGSYF